MLIGSKHAVKNTRPLQIVLDGKPMKQSDCFKYLGIYIHHCLSWGKHVTYIQSRKQTVPPLLDYGCVVMDECSKENAQYLERLQNWVMRITLHADRKTRRFIKLQYVYKIINNINCPKQLTGYLVKRSQRHRRSVRDPILLDPPLVKTNLGRLHLSSRLRVPETNCQERYVS
ncbi:hypothetical protein P5673_032136 [Acropora cervicornis]|uniref:Uncharacterized protein n=1 Tax=Acropora cervicornis TaxID=6130 RepID=A0AAD9PRZ0_ACRCE|nr:hypothetical protein P5673_032136 [Acropora cervicornis]